MSDSIFELTDYDSPLGNWLDIDPIVSIHIFQIDIVKVDKKERFKIIFSVSSNVDISGARASLLTSNEKTGALSGLGKTVDIRRAKTPNYFEISINRDSYDKHVKNSAPNPLLFFIQLDSPLLKSPVKSEEFTMKTFSIRVTGFKIEKHKKDATKDLFSFSFLIRVTNTNAKQVGVRMVEDFGNLEDEFLPERFPLNSNKEKPPKYIDIKGEYANGKIGIRRFAIEARMNDERAGAFFIWAYLDGERVTTKPLDFTKEFSEIPEGISDSCGIEYRDQIYCTRYLPRYGPRYRGSIKLADYSGWDNLIASGTITDRDKEVLVAMSENEGNLDGVQGYDDQIVTVGAMQKVIDPNGAGEFATQMYEFKEANPEIFKILFENCGWTVKKKSGTHYAYYNNTTGSALKKLITKGFTKQTYAKKVQCKPIEPLINACKSIIFQGKQVEDFIARLDKYMNLTPHGYSPKISAYIHTDLGRATVLDQSVNRPAHVTRYFAKALDDFKVKYPTIPESPSDWGTNHNSYEKKFLDIYGPLRNGQLTYGGKTMRGMTDGVDRYNNLKAKLPIT